MRKPNYASRIVLKNAAKILLVLLIFGLAEYIAWNKIRADFSNGKWNVAFIEQLIIFCLGIGSGIFFLKFDSWFNEFMDNKFDNIRNALTGNKGEKAVLTEIKKELGEKDHKFYRNMTLPRGKYDIDILILGPTGLTAFEVKNWSCEVKFYDKHFDKINRLSDYKEEITHNYKQKDDPRNRIAWASQHLKDYIIKQDSTLDNIHIATAVVFIKETAKWEGKAGTYIVSGLHNLKHFIESNKAEPISADVYQRLEEICNELEK